MACSTSLYYGSPESTDPSSSDSCSPSDPRSWLAPAMASGDEAGSVSLLSFAAGDAGASSGGAECAALRGVPGLVLGVGASDRLSARLRLARNIRSSLPVGLFGAAAGGESGVFGAC